MRYLETVRLAMWMPWVRRRSRMSLSVSGLPSLAMASFMMSFTLRLGVKKCEYGMTSPFGNSAYLLAVARLTVLS